MGSIGTKIGKALGKGHNALRKVFFDTHCLHVYSQSQGPYVAPTASYDTNWYLDRLEYSDVVAGKKYKRLVVDDVDGCRLPILRAATAFQVQDLVFKINQKPSFVGSVPSYEFRIQPTGERV